MQKPNEMINPKIKCNTARRALLKNTATVAGLATISPAISFASSQPSNKTLVEKTKAELASDYQQEQHQHIVSVLNKYAAKSKRVTAEHIDRFATGFTKMNGDLNYKETFKNLDGEYRLVKLFIKSLNAST